MILNWNGLGFLSKFLPGVVKHSSDLAEICVVDNASSDAGLDWVRTHEPTVKIIENSENFGFAKGYNVGLEQIDSEIYVLLNSDVEVTAGWLTPVLNYFDQTPNLAACQPQIMDYQRKTYFEHAGAAGGFIDKDGFTFCKGRIFYQFEENHDQYSPTEEVFWASGAALFVRAEAYHKVGGLDPDFFAHMEEIDLCWRLKNRGYSIGACRQSIVYHVGGGTLNKVNPFKTFLNFRNNLYLLTKNYFGKPLIGVLLRRMILDGIAAFRFLTEFKVKDFFAVIKAHFSFYFHLRSALQKRKQLKKELNNPNLTGLYHRSILLDFFFKKRHHFADLDQSAFHNTEIQTDTPREVLTK